MSDAIMTTEMAQECVENDAAEAYKELLIESHPYGEVRISEASLDEARAIGAKEFNRWLAEHDRQVKAQALEEAADDVWAQFGPTVMGPGDLDDVYFPEWLRARAQQLKEEA